MFKTLLSGGALIAVALASSGAYAIGGGPTPPSASPYAILEPQTVSPQATGPYGMTEGRSAYIGERDNSVRPQSGERRYHRSHRHAPTPEQ